MGDHNGVCTYNKVDFHHRFQMRRTLFNHIIQRVCAWDEFFTQRCDATGKPGAMPYQKDTASPHMLAHGTSADQLDDYIRLSETKIMLSLQRFCEAIIQEFGSTYLHRPNEDDANLILKMS